MIPGKSRPSSGWAIHDRTSGSQPLRETLAALVAYLTISVVYFGLPIFRQFSHSFIGADRDTDPSHFMWGLAWWPHAVLHGLNPILPRVIWAPSGLNLAWVTPAPAANVLAAPLTLTLGVVVTCNVIALLTRLSLLALRFFSAVT